MVSCQYAGEQGPRPWEGEGREAGLPGHPGPGEHSPGTITMPADPTAQTVLFQVP